MVRGKTQMKRIENNSSRQVTFSKRRSGILKKAFELSVLCDVEVALLIFSPSGKLYEFASSGSIKSTIERYQRHNQDSQGTISRSSQSTTTTRNMATLEEASGTAVLEKKIKALEISKRRLMGDDLGGCSLEELKQLQRQLEKSLSNIRARKNQVLLGRINKLKEEEKLLLEENAKLKEKLQLTLATGELLFHPDTIAMKANIQSLPRQRGELLFLGNPNNNDDVCEEDDHQDMDMETELFIGLPCRRSSSGSSSLN